MKTRNLTLTLVAVTALLVGAAGCGGGDKTLTKAQVIKRGSAICRAAQRHVEATPAPRLSCDCHASAACMGDSAGRSR